ncbi:zinc finger C2HC domain-containing protein 1B isoform X2 [Crotalus tigris]|uniref:zinc finger C2HC domain-containing protein 1B isoform X2 n=1 Tax=Crotalus tigris TaxID=88082 RepID=UPI00192F30BD|nr:zinc finger C2HC domain-containing protein 1B isoform X2 [Crotalus tigris]
MSVDSENKAYATEVGAPNLLPCDTCGRHFASEALARHNLICKKIFNKKRKPFNSLKQRLQGTDIPTVKKKPPTKNGLEKKSNWRQQHEDFISAIRAAKLATQAMKEGRPLPPPPPPSINPGKTRSFQKRTNFNKCCGDTTSKQIARDKYWPICNRVLYRYIVVLKDMVLKFQLEQYTKKYPLFLLEQNLGLQLMEEDKNMPSRHLNSSLYFLQHPH